MFIVCNTVFSSSGAHLTTETEIVQAKNYNRRCAVNFGKVEIPGSTLSVFVFKSMFIWA